jgi:hypothetical protein
MTDVYRAEFTSLDLRISCQLLFTYVTLLVSSMYSREPLEPTQSNEQNTVYAPPYTLPVQYEFMRSLSPAPEGGDSGAAYCDDQIPLIARTYLYTPSLAANHSVASSWNVMLAQPPSTTAETRSVPGSTAGVDQPIACTEPVWFSRYTPV